MRSGNSQQSSTAKRLTPIHLRTGQSFLERLGVLFAYPIRRTIVLELHLREMSPTQFYEQVGGTSYGSVRRHFIKLTEAGWLRRVRDAPSGGGRPEHLYRSAELGIIDDETWAQLPVSIRDAFTLDLLEEMGERLAASLGSEAFGSREDVVVSFASLILDEIGWQEAIGTVNRSFRAIFEEQTDAKIRLEKSGGTPILMVVELAGFEASPGAGRRPPVDLRPKPTPDSLGAGPERIAKVLADPLNLAIVNLLNDASMCPGQLASALVGVSPESCVRRCRTLERYGWIAKVGERTGGALRGATEYLYRATAPALPRLEVFGDLPEEVRDAEAWTVFGEFLEGAQGSVKAGVFNREPNRHLTLSTLLLDETGWTQVNGLLRACARSLIGIEQVAKYRVRKGAAPMPTGFFGAAFVSSPLNQ